MKKYVLLVNGKELDTGRYRYYPYTDSLVKNPGHTMNAVNEVTKGNKSDKYKKFIYAEYCIGNRDTNESAVNAAYEAARKFKHYPLSTRKKICYDIMKLLKARKRELLELLIIEGHPMKLAEWELSGMEIGAGRQNIDFYSSLLFKEINKDAKEQAWLYRRPDGVVCVSPPANASACNSFLCILALLAGNSLVIKPPLNNPLSTIYLWKEIVNKALNNHNAPPGTINIILGNSKLIMKEWLSSRKVNDIVFFGDSRVGIDIGAKIYSAGKKPILELSGNDTQVVWKDADIGEAVNSALDCFLGSTQICMVPKRILIHEKIYDRFVSVITTKVKEIKPGLPSDPDTILSPVTRIKDCFEFLEDALHNGAKLLCGGERVNHKGDEDDEGLYVRPALLRVDDDQFTHMRCFNEEIFFPLLPLVKVSGRDGEIFDRIAELVSLNPYGLRISVWVNSVKYGREFMRVLSNSGLLRINLPHVGFSPYLSTHGGTKLSGGPFGGMNNIWEKTSSLQGVSKAIL